MKSSIVGAWKGLQKALRNVIQIFQIEISRPKLNFKSYKKQIEEYDGFADTMSTSASEAAPAPAVLEEDQVEEVFRVEGAEEEDVDLIIYPESILPQLEFTVPEAEEEKTKVKTIQEKIDESFCKRGAETKDNPETEQDTSVIIHNKAKAETKPMGAIIPMIRKTITRTTNSAEEKLSTTFKSLPFLSIQRMNVNDIEDEDDR